MDNIPRVFLDLDGVIIDFVQGAIDWYVLDCKFEDVDHWGYLECASGLTEKEFWEGMTDKFWLGLKMLRHAYPLLALLKPYDPCILTSPSLTSAGVRQKWIRDNMPDYFDAKRYLIGPAKADVAREGAVLIDDSEINISAWRSAGGVGFLYPQPWNKFKGQDFGLTASLLHSVLWRLTT